MAEYIFRTLQEIDLPREEVFEFFSNAENLERITPPELGFNIITPLPIDIKKGTLIDYRLSLHGFPIKWRTEITHWEPPFEFIDMQLRGPYKQWIHTHRFTEPEPGKTLMEDEVRYRLPFEPVGDVVKFLVGGKIKKIFDYRRQAVNEYFSIGT
ncbi:MAG TPA: SRPBCC family protein [Pyrinomonadaceae bacterium]|nr:SRPBCC family protein [Pyrinomonadaceae bacterium]